MSCHNFPLFFKVAIYSYYSSHFSPTALQVQRFPEHTVGLNNLI